MSETAIKVDHIHKEFLLPHAKKSSIKGVFSSLFKKEDRRYEHQRALKDVSFEVKKGEFFGIVGRNGSGKSTLLKILAGIYQPSKGNVSVSGKLVPFIELGVGFNPELTGRENVFLNGAMLGFSEKEVAAMYDDIVQFAELERFMDQKLKNYSSGMQVRLAFSMATRSEADVLLVDEVLAVGDAEFQRKCFDYFRELKKRKKTVIFVSHDMGSVREYCDRAILIEDSRLIKEGSSNIIADEYTKLFIPKDSQLGDQEGNRSGNQDAVISKVTTKKKVLNEATITLSLKCRISKAIEGLNIGFKLKDPLGRPLLGTSTHLNGIKLANLKAGDEFNLDFSFDNLLNAGTYAVDVIAENMNGDMCDWWIDATKITVYKEKKTGYPVEPSIEVRKH